MVATAYQMKPPSTFDRQVEAALVIWFEPNWPAIIASGEPTSSMQRVWLPGVQRDDQEGPACRTASKSTGRPC